MEKRTSSGNRDDKRRRETNTGSGKSFGNRKGHYKKDDTDHGKDRPARSKSYEKDAPRSAKPYGKSRDSAAARPYGDKDTQRPAYRKDKPHGFKSKPKSRQVITYTGDGLIRLNKFISNSGVCSRREADVLITAGVITVNGKIETTLGTKVSKDDTVVYEGQTLTAEKKAYVLLNKPKDFITTLDDPQGRKTVMELVKNAGDFRLFPVGRLDRNTTGLLLLTNDGELTKRLTHPKHGVKKLYHVGLDKPLTRADMATISQGIELEGEKVVPDAISYVGEEVDKTQVGIELHSGQNRVVRRIFESLDYKVIKLDRVLFAGLTKRDLPRGHWRFLNDKEVQFLKMI